MNARVTLRRYPGRAHTVSADEVRYATAILNEAFGSPALLSEAAPSLFIPPLLTSTPLTLPCHSRFADLSTC